MQLFLKILLLIFSIFLFSCSNFIENNSDQEVFIFEIQNYELPDYINNNLEKYKDWLD